MRTFLKFILIALLGVISAEAQIVVNCDCLRTQAVLNVTGCVGTVPDLCLFTQCIQSTVVPPPPYQCSQTPAAGTIVGPGTHPIMVTVSVNGQVLTQCPVVFTVTPNTAPFALLCSSNKTVNCAAPWIFDPPVATNVCCNAAGIPGNVTVTVVSTVTNGVCPQVITRTWRAIDDCGHVATCSQTVTVVDTTPPTINCGQNETVVCGQGWGFTVPIISDNCSSVGNGLTLSIISTTTNLTCGQTYVATRVWQVTDACGNKTLCTQVVTVVDFTPPVITCPADKTVPCGTAWNFGIPSASETCLTGVGNASVTLAVVSTVTNNLCPLVVTRTWSATDGCGNSSQCSQTVTVGGPGGLTLNCAALASLPELQTNACLAYVPSLCAQAIALVQQNCPCQLTCSQTPTPGTQVGPGTHPITITLTDGSGNSVSCVVNFVVTPPPGGCNPCPNQTNVWNTGMSGTNVLAAGQPDPNYLFVSAPPGGCNGPAQVLLPSSIPAPPWVANGLNSQWIGAGPTANCQEGVYHYRLCFYLSCTEGASIIGQWAADDHGAIHLNGQPTGNSIPSLQYPNLPGYGWFPVSITNGFICGTNCLDFYVTNALIGVNPTGFRAELTNVFNDCCCGPLQAVSTYHSGVNANGLMPVLSPDPQLVLSCAPPGVATGPAQVTFTNPFWMPNGPDSQWLAPVGNPNLPGGLYCYTYRFTLPPCTNGTPKYAVKGQWMGDDAGTIYVNGNPTGNNLPNGWAFTNWHPISVTSGLVPGVNTLTFYVTNASAGDTGIRLELTNYASCCDCVMTNCNVTINCSTNLDIQACAFVNNQAVVTYPLPTASSTCGTITSIVCTPPSGSPFPLGITTVNCTATDANGNSASCSFNIRVRRDITPPVIDCACLQALASLSVRACSAPIPNFCAAQCYSDDCTPAAQLICTQSPAAGTIVPGGASYAITVTVTDAAGNSSQCQVGFTVIAPVEERVWNTGAASPNAANFTVIQTPGGPANIPAVLTAPAGGAWSPNTPASSWVSFTPNSQNAAIGVYVYRLTFNVPCTNGASIVGRFMSDDAARVYLNGVPAAALSTSFSAWSPVNLTSGFVPGLNTLDIYVTNAIIWTGLRTELTNRFTCCCPSSIVLNCPPKPVNAWTCGTAPIPVNYNVTASSLCSNVTVSVKCVPPSGSLFPANTSTLVTCTATDSLGNTTSCTFPVTVVRDIIPPVIMCPGPITRVLCTNSVAVYYKAKAKDDCSPTVSIACVPPSGTVFNTGTTIVTCTATDACGNTSSCSFPVKVINNLLWQTLPAGINDCYAQSGWEPNSPGVCLNTAYPGGNWKNFDVTTVNRWVGHTWTFPASWNILAAQLATRARPPVNGCSGNSQNDSFSLGLANCSPATWLWSRYLGSGNASAGLVDKQWCNGSGCQYLFNFNLASMPLAPSGTISLLPHMNSAKRLDYFAQDDTTVDFAHLRVLRCAPKHVIGGVAVELNNAKIAYGPAFWCIIRDVVALPNFRADFSLGLADGARFPMEPVTLGDHPGSSIQIEGVATESVPGPRLELGLGNAEGSAVIRLNGLPPGVPVIRIEVEIDGVVVQTVELPATDGMELATFDSASPVVALALANQNELLATIIENEPDQAPRKVTLRVRLPGYGGGFTGASLHATALPEITLETPQLQFTGRASVNRAVAVRFSSSDASLSEVSGGQAVLSPLDSESTEPISITASFAPTDEFRAVVPSPFGMFGSEPTNATLRNIVRGIISGEEVDVDQVEFSKVPGGYDVAWSSARIHPVRRIYLVYGPSGVRRFEVPGNSNLVVTVTELPTMIGKLGGRTPCRRLHWPKPVTLIIAGQTFEANELRILVETDNYPVTALTGLRIEAVGAESLTLPVVDVGPNVHVLDAPELTEDAIFIRWSGFGGLLEESDTVTGPWAPSADQTETPGEVVKPRPTDPAKFFRVRGD